MAITIQSTRGQLYIAGGLDASSIAPPIHNCTASQLQRDWNMQSLPARTVQSVAEVFRKRDFLGGSVTMPWKTSVIPYLDEVDEVVSLLGACNTVCLSPNSIGRLRGTNTEWTGIQRAIDAATPRRHVGTICGMIYGAGVGSRAAFYTLAVSFSVRTIYIVNRDDDEVLQLLSDSRKYAEKVHFKLVHVQTVQDARKLPVPTYVIDTAPDFEPRTAGEMRAEAVLREFPHQGRDGEAVLLDMCYDPRLTRNLRLGGELGWTTVDGVQVYAQPFKVQWELWTDVQLSEGIEQRAILFLEAQARADQSVGGESSRKHQGGGFKIITRLSAMELAPSAMLTRKRADVRNPHCWPVDI